MSSLTGPIQGTLGATFLLAGLIKLSQPREKLAAGCMTYMEDLTDGQVRCIGILEVSAAVALIISLAVNGLLVLTLVAAAGLVVLMTGAARTHQRRREPVMLPVNLLLGGMSLCLFVTHLGSHSL
jgi:uncharacterized membrane protein